MNEGADIRIDLTMPTMDQLHAIMPRCDLAIWHRPLIATMGRWHLVTPMRQAAWLAQIAVESSECTRLEEGLYYKPPSEGGKHALSKLFRSHFKDEAEAAVFYRNPHGLALKVYGHPPGNGAITYHGRGCIQVSLEPNYRACGEALGLPLLEHPELLLQPEHAAQSAGWYWDWRSLNALADAMAKLAKPEMLAHFKVLTRKVNAGLAGMTERLAYLQKGMEVLSA